MSFIDEPLVICNLVGWRAGHPVCKSSYLRAFCPSWNRCGSEDAVTRNLWWVLYILQH